MKLGFLALLFSIIFLGGCSVADGGGSTHLPPAHVKVGTPIDLRLEFTVWGKNQGIPLDRRYTRIRCHYRDIAKTDYQIASARVLTVDAKTMTVVMTLPPDTLVGAVGVDYYFDFLFDGRYNRQDKPPLVLAR